MIQNDNIIVLRAYLYILVLTESVHSLKGCFFLCVAESPLISQWLPAKSGAALRYGPWLLIWVQMIDSLEGETTGLALWLAVTALSHSVTRKESKEKKGESNKSTSGATDGGQQEKEVQKSETMSDFIPEYFRILNVCLSVKKKKNNPKTKAKPTVRKSGTFQGMKKITGKEREQVWQCREEIKQLKGK